MWTECATQPNQPCQPAALTPAPTILTAATTHCAQGVECDIWSAGVLCYVLMGGYPPFRAEDDDRDILFAQILDGAYEVGVASIVASTQRVVLLGWPSVSLHLCHTSPTRSSL